MAEKKLSFDNPLFRAEPLNNEPEEKKRGRPRRDGLVRNEDGGQSAQEGLTEEATRFSVICKVRNVKDLKDYAFTKRITIREAMDEILEKFFDDYRSDPNNEDLLDHTRGK